MYTSCICFTAEVQESGHLGGQLAGTLLWPTVGNQKLFPSGPPVS